MAAARGAIAGPARPAPPPRSTVTALLAAHAAAVLRHDPQAGSPAEDLRAVPLAAWAYHVLAVTTAPAGVVVRTRLDYRIAGFDTRPRQVLGRCTLRRRAGRWTLAGCTDDPGSPRPLWDFGPVTVVATPRVLVLGHPDERALLAEIAREADADVALVSRVWRAPWPQRPVVVVPASAPELRAVLGPGPDPARLAAVETAELARGAPLAQRIVVNRAAFARLSAAGRRVVLTHELTHVATSASTTPTTPAWLVEGYADFIGYTGSTIPLRAAAAELESDLRAGRAPTALPTAAQFAATNPDLAAVYEQAWLACRLIASRYGPARLGALYRAAGTARSPNGGGAALGSVLHLSIEEFTSAWLAYLHAALA